MTFNITVIHIIICGTTFIFITFLISTIVFRSVDRLAVIFHCSLILRFSLRLYTPISPLVFHYLPNLFQCLAPSSVVLPSALFSVINSNNNISQTIWYILWPIHSFRLLTAHSFYNCLCLINYVRSSTSLSFTISIFDVLLRVHISNAPVMYPV